MQLAAAGCRGRDELVDLGATVDQPVRVDTATRQRHFVLTHDPEGHEFCAA